LSIKPDACAPVALVTTDESSMRAVSNSHSILDYFSQVQGRDSYDGKSSPLVSVVHAGTGFNGAYWSLKGHFMAYGDGDGVTGDTARALDIAAHEFTHAVTESEAGLLSLGESGALNEAYSDFFGELVEGPSSWVIGDRLPVKAGDPGLRDLARPANL